MQTDEGTNTLTEDYISTDSGFLMMIIERFTTGVGLFYLNFVILIILYYILKLTVGALLKKIFGACFKICCFCCVKSQAKIDKEKAEQKALAQAKGLDVHSQDILTDFRIGPLNDKFNKSRKELNKFNKLKVMSPELFEGVNREMMHKMEKHLNRRVSAQMGVIDYHINLLCQEMDQHGSGGYLPGEYKELSYDLKLKLLIANESILLERQKATKEAILRMKGLTQSYYMYDSVTYQKANAMIKKLEAQASNPTTNWNQSMDSMGAKGDGDIEMIPVKTKDGEAQKDTQVEKGEDFIEGNNDQILA